MEADEFACVLHHAHNLYGKSESATSIFPALAMFGIPDILRAMEHEEKQRLARTGDVSKEAVSYRLRAAREAIRPRRSQKAMAEEFGVAISTYASWEIGDVFPSVEVIRHFRREYEFTFDFIIYGDWLRLPGDVQERVFDAMLEREAKADRGSASQEVSRG